MVKLITPTSRIVDVTGASGLGIVQSQVISDDLLQSCADARAINGKVNSKDSPFEVKVADVPAVIVNKWMREGFNIFEQKGPAGLQAIMDRLRREDLTAFLCTNMRFA